MEMGKIDEVYLTGGQTAVQLSGWYLNSWLYNARMYYALDAFL